MSEENYSDRKSYVCIEGEYIPFDEDKMEFLNIESDEYGRDVLTFIYDNKKYKSLIVLK